MEEKNPEKEETYEESQEFKEKEISEKSEKEITQEKIIPKNEKGEGSFAPVIFVMILSIIIAGLWDKNWVSGPINYILNPTAGSLLNWNLSWGMLIIVFVITVIVTFVQKYATDQDKLKELKKEQKEVQKQMKEFKNHPEKMLELQKKSFSMMSKQMKLGMRGIVYTGIPFILFFRWFRDLFATLPEETKFFGIFGSWFLFYLVFALIFGSILRKKFDVV